MGCGLSAVYTMHTTGMGIGHLSKYFEACQLPIHECFVQECDARVADRSYTAR